MDLVNALWVKENKTSLVKESIIATAICFAIGHSFFFFNIMPQHDSINHMLHFDGDWEIQCG